MEKVVVKLPLESEGVPPLIADQEESLEIFGEILRRGAMFYPEEDQAANGFPRVYRILPLSES